MMHSMDLAHGVHTTGMGIRALPAILLSHLRELQGLITWRVPERRRMAALVRLAGARFRTAYRTSAREQKVALLGLALVLAVLTWP